jgi:hypothetical protein
MLYALRAAYSKEHIGWLRVVACKVILFYSYYKLVMLVFDVVRLNVDFT